MYNRYIFPLHVVHHNLPHLGIHSPIPQEQQVSSLERRLHGSRKYHHDRRRRVRHHREAFPHHEGCRENKRKVEDLGGHLSRLHCAESEHRCGCAKACAVRAACFLFLFSGTARSRFCRFQGSLYDGGDVNVRVTISVVHETGYSTGREIVDGRVSATCPSTRCCRRPSLGKLPSFS